MAGTKGEGAGEGTRHLLGAAALLAGSQVLSRLLGVARDAVLAAAIGRGAAADAYVAAFQIPDLLNHFLAGGALTIAFIPLYHRARARGGEPAADRLFASVLGTVGALALLATGVVWVFAEPLVALQFPRFSPEQQALTARLTRIVTPAQFFFLTGGILRAVLMAHGRFGAQAASGLVYNLGIIAGGLLAAPLIGVEGFAWGALVGAIAGPFGLGFVQVRRRAPIPLRIRPFDADFARYLALAAPLMVGVTLATVDEWYGRWVGGLGPEGTVAALAYARKLMQAPVAVVGQALGTAALPTLSRLHAQARHADFEALLGRALQAGVGLALLAGAALFAVAEPLVVLVYQRGAFTASDAQLVAGTLRLYAFAIPGFVLQTLAARSFYARGDMWRPMLLGTVLAVAAVPVYVGLLPGGAPGLAGAAALAIAGSALATLGYARLRYGGPALARLGVGFLRTGLAALAAGAVASALPTLGSGAPGAMLTLLAQGGAFALVALPLAWWLGDRDLRAALGRLVPRRGGAG